MTSSIAKDIKKPNFCAYKCLMNPSFFSLSDSLSQCCIYIYTLIKLSQHLIFTCFNYCVQWSREFIHLNKYREIQIDQIKNFRHAVYSLSFRTNISSWDEFLIFLWSILWATWTHMINSKDQASFSPPVVTMII